MVVLGLMDLLLWVSQQLSNVIFPAVPQEVTTYVSAVFGYIDQGIGVLRYCFVDLPYVGVLCSWLLDVLVILFTVDLGWRLIDHIKARRKTS